MVGVDKDLRGSCDSGMGSNELLEDSLCLPQLLMGLVWLPFLAVVFTQGLSNPKARAPGFVWRTASSCVPARRVNRRRSLHGLTWTNFGM